MLFAAKMCFTKVEPYLNEQWNMVFHHMSFSSPVFFLFNVGKSCCWSTYDSVAEGFSWYTDSNIIGTLGVFPIECNPSSSEIRINSFLLIILNSKSKPIIWIVFMYFVGKLAYNKIENKF